MLNVVMSAELVNKKEQKEKLIADFESEKYGLLICKKGLFKAGLVIVRPQSRGVVF